jgi:predicted ATPase
VGVAVLTSLGIQGFKAIFEASLTDLGPLTVLIGRNGSGKSSAVEAIQWLRDATFLGLDAATSSHADFAELLNRRSRALQLDLRFKRDTKGRPVHYTVSVARAAFPPRQPIVELEKCVVDRTAGARIVVRSRKGKRGPAYRWVEDAHGKLPVRDSNELALRFTRTRATPGAEDLVDFLDRAVFLRLSPTAIALPSRGTSRAWRPMLAEDGSDLASLLVRMTPAKRAAIAKRLSEIFPDVESLNVVTTGGEHRFLVRERMRARGGTRPFDIPSTLLSEGTRRLVAIFALLEARPRPSLLVVEEVENGLDPWTLEHVLDALRQAAEETQIILTTHSPFLLDHVDAEEVLHVRRDMGDTTYERVADMEDVARYRGVLAPGAIYLSNVLKDVAPNGG